MTGGFRIQNVTIEGFKAFTTRQEIVLRGRHVFLLGQNGNGKSSIIEAIRWGLFGSTGRPNEIVANRGYSDACRVEITLMRSGKHWNFRRTLIRGASRGSDAVLTDDQGQEHAIRDLMPQLDSVNAGEGTHIIFAPQATPLRRQPEDLDAFERTVFHHLGLTNPRALLSQLQAFLSVQQELEARLAGRLGEARREVEDNLAHFERQRGIILSSPPWNSDHPPSIAESDNKVRGLIKEFDDEEFDSALSGLSLDALLEKAEEFLVVKQHQGNEGLEKKLSEIGDRRNRLVAFRELQEKVELQQATVRKTQSLLGILLEGTSIDEIRGTIQEMITASETNELRRRIVEEASLLLKRQQTDEVSCPVCEVVHDRLAFETTINCMANELSQDKSSDLIRLETKLRSAEDLSQKIESHKESLSELTKELNVAKLDGEECSSDQVTVEEVQSLIDLCSERERSIEAQMDSEEAWYNERKANLARLKEEGKFHQIQKTLQNLNQSRNRFTQVERTFQDLVSLNESVRAICQAVEFCLNERLRMEIPTVSANLSKVFSSLTQHSWFDQLEIARETLPKLELRVMSSSDPSRVVHPTGVLNGQAESALALVPYFAFSQADDAPTEVYLVLLDDPTRAFDEEHTRILVERLAELGRNVQLIVASQETDRFLKLLPENFDTSSYVIIEPTKWSYHDGPELVIEGK